MVDAYVLHYSKRRLQKEQLILKVESNGNFDTREHKCNKTVYTEFSDGESGKRRIVIKKFIDEGNDNDVIDDNSVYKQSLMLHEVIRLDFFLETSKESDRGFEMVRYLHCADNFIFIVCVFSSLSYQLPVKFLLFFRLQRAAIYFWILKRCRSFSEPLTVTQGKYQKFPPKVNVSTVNINFSYNAVRILHVIAKIVEYRHLGIKVRHKIL